MIIEGPAFVSQQKVMSSTNQRSISNEVVMDKELRADALQSHFEIQPVNQMETVRLSTSSDPNLQNAGDLQTFEDIFYMNATEDMFSDYEEEKVYEVHSSVYLPVLYVSLYLRHHLTKTALSDHLLILRMAINSNVKQLTSPHNLLAKYSNLKTETSKISLCPFKKCPAILKMKEDKVNEPEEKQPCGHKFIKSIHTPCFIIRMPIAKQLEYFILHHGLRKEEWDPNFRGDVQSGDCYKKLRDLGTIDDFTITVTWNTDMNAAIKDE